MSLHANGRTPERAIVGALRTGGERRWAVDESLDELYWYLLAAAAGCLGIGTLFVKQRVQLGLGFLAALGLLALVSSLRS